MKFRILFAFLAMLKICYHVSTNLYGIRNFAQYVYVHILYEFKESIL
jgi:hypothetical protein